MATMAMEGKEMYLPVQDALSLPHEGALRVQLADPDDIFGVSVLP